MEDISRELEREIARAKPSLHRSKNKSQILIIDDFGSLKSGEYLKVLVYVLSVISLLGIVGSAGFYSLFAGVKKETTGVKDRLAVAEKKVDRLINDKEILMARLVMAGKKPDLPPPVKEQAIPLAAQKEKTPEETPVATVQDASLLSEKTAGSVLETIPDKTAGQPTIEPQVAVEKFSVVQGKTPGRLSVKFNVRNISTRSKEISGRILAVLKPKFSTEEEWIVVPHGRLENKLPRPYTKGQYFSISRFKPVRFTINNPSAPDHFELATVYIFDEDGKLFFETTLQINGPE